MIITRIEHVARHFLLLALLAWSTFAMAFGLLHVDDLWPYELACRHASVKIHHAHGGPMASIRAGRIYRPEGTLMGEIRQCDRIHEPSGSVLARRANDGRFYAADGRYLGRQDAEGRWYDEQGRLVLVVRDNAVKDAAGRLLARYRVE